MPWRVSHERGVARARWVQRNTLGVSEAWSGSPDPDPDPDPEREIDPAPKRETGL